MRKKSFEIPAPHGHLYNEEYDNCEIELINGFEWMKTALRSEDEQLLFDRALVQEFNEIQRNPIYMQNQSLRKNE